MNCLGHGVCVILVAACANAAASNGEPDGGAHPSADGAGALDAPADVGPGDVSVDGAEGGEGPIGPCAGFSYTYDKPATPLDLTQLASNWSSTTFSFKSGEIVNFAFRTGAGEPTAMYNVSAYEYGGSPVYRREILTSRRCVSDATDPFAIESQAAQEPGLYFMVQGAAPPQGVANLAAYTTYYVTLQNVSPKGAASCPNQPCPTRIAVIKTM